jgi:hypothetical protein
LSFRAQWGQTIACVMAVAPDETRERPKPFSKLHALGWSFN